MWINYRLAQFEPVFVSLGRKVLMIPQPLPFDDFMHKKVILKDLDYFAIQMRKLSGLSTEELQYLEQIESVIEAWKQKLLMD